MRRHTGDVGVTGTIWCCPTLVIEATSIRLVAIVIAAILRREVCVICAQWRGHSFVLNKTEIFDLCLLRVSPFMLQVFSLKIEELVLRASPANVLI